VQTAQVLIGPGLQQWLNEWFSMQDKVKGIKDGNCIKSKKA
jgi:hypothetical protein